MIRVLVAATASVVVVTAVLAQSDVAAQRTDLMKAQGQCVYRVLGGMAKPNGDPYDQAKVDDCLAKLKESTAKIPSLFPASAKGVNDPKAQYIVLDKLYDNKADVDARVAKLQKDLQDAATKAKTEEGFKAVFPGLREDCNGCHDSYRQKKG